MKTREIPTPGRPRPVVLCVLDGWGHGTETEHNAIAQAATLVYDRLMGDRPHATLETSGRAVGLPEGAIAEGEMTGRSLLRPRQRDEGSASGSAVFGHRRASA